MKLGFKKSIFGFNCNEVIGYIKKNHELFIETKEKYEEEIKQLKSKIDSQEHSISFLSSELDKYVEKEAEINELAEKIAEMYLVSKSGAEAILQNAVDNKIQSEKLVESNLEAVTNANNTLENLETELSQTVETFNKKVESLKQNLSETKQDLKLRNEDSEGFQKVFQEISK